MKITNQVSEREVAPEGTFNAICVQIVDLGTQTSVYKGKEKDVHKISFSFEIQDEVNSSGEPFYVYKNYSLSLAPKSSLSKDLKTWKGVTVERGKSFDVATLLGQPALVTIVHNEGDGVTYANIQGIAALMKGTKIKKAKADLIGFYMDGKVLDTKNFDKLGEYLQTKISESAEFQALAKGGKSKKK